MLYVLLAYEKVFQREYVSVLKCWIWKIEWQRQWLGQQAACLSEWKGAHKALAAFCPISCTCKFTCQLYSYTRKSQSSQLLCLTLIPVPPPPLSKSQTPDLLLITFCSISSFHCKIGNIFCPHTSNFSPSCKSTCLTPLEGLWDTGFEINVCAFLPERICCFKAFHISLA